MLRRKHPLLGPFALLAAYLAAAPTLASPQKAEDQNAEKQGRATPERLGVAAVSMSPGPEPVANLHDMVAWIHRIVDKHPAAQVVAFGETILGRWFDPKAPEHYQRSVAEPIPGPATNLLGTVAREHGIHLAFGMAEAGPEQQLFNSYVLVKPTGDIAAVHRKVNLTAEDILSGFTPGDGPTKADIRGVPVALLVCADGESPPLIADTAALRPHIILQGLATGRLGKNLRYDPVARSTGAWTVFSNRWGVERGYSYSGLVYVADPQGMLRTRTRGDEGYVYTRIPVHRT